MSDVETRGREKTASTVVVAGPAQAARVPSSPESVTRDEEGSFGRALAAARQARGLTQSDVATELRLQLRQVKAIEEEDLAALPEGPFVRGFVRNYARLVDLPAEPLLSLLNSRLRPTEPLRGLADGSKAVSPIQRLPREPISGRLVIGGALLALVVFAFFGWWAMRPAQQAEPAAPPQPAPAVGVAPPATAPAAAEPAVVAGAAAAPASAALRLRFRDRSWVEIRQEADGAVLLKQNNPAGTEQTIDGVPPYTLVIGNASKVELEFRGEPVDLSAWSSRDDVARLRLE
jgi:cytoskeleton protein RodZ